MTIPKNSYTCGQKSICTLKPVKGLRVSKAVTIVLTTFFTFFTSCSPDLFDDPIPIVFFQPVEINLALPQYINLNTVGYVYVNAGVRGIILHKKNFNTYLAFERNCSYQPNQACATVDVHTSNLFLQDVCCGSTFNWDGNPTGGIAWRPLRQYQTILNGNLLTITDEILN
ncbi:MAG: hypothetical protein KF725_02530 [Cyclobacteriaceae bacterium]|nr:hypothetical protein [Cyclobacteriaceae bacterium]UYN86687.1 MAG: hypothetical protein KIT51_17805 [Cyclobacteriaceae bacterium]